MTAIIKGLNNIAQGSVTSKGVDLFNTRIV